MEAPIARGRALRRRSARGRTGRGVAVLGLALALGAAAGCGPDPTTPSADSQPLAGSSVLLVTLDTTRADVFGAFGGPPYVAPHLDEWAREGVRFTQARSVAPLTLPAHASLMTGVFPFEHGVRDNGSFALPAAADTLAERFHRAGYRTGAVVAAFVLDSSFGLAEGFDAYLDAPRSRLEFVAAEEERSADEVVAAALDWLERGPGGEPFFLWTHFFDPHFPYDARPEVLDALPPADEIPGSAGLPKIVSVQRRRYLAEVSGLDGPLARLLAEAARHARGDLLAIVVADHGEALGEHGELTHGYLLHDAVLRIPLIFRHPSLAAGRVVDDPVSIVDVAPTVASLVGLDPAGMSGADLSPRLLPGDGGRVVTQRPIYMETLTTWLSHGWSPLYALVADGKKVVLGPEAELYDLSSDPGENADSADRDPEAVAAARRRFATLAERVTPSERRGLSEDEIQSLRALGYLEGEADPGRNAGVAPGWIPEGAGHPRAEMGQITRFWRARDLLRAGRIEEGLAGIRAVARDEPDDPYLLNNVGALLTNHGHPEEALPLIERALRLAPDAESRLALAATLARLDRKPEAVEILGELTRLSPDLLVARLDVAELLIDLGRNDEAVPHLEALLAHLSGDGPLRARALLVRARS